MGALSRGFSGSVAQLRFACLPLAARAALNKFIGCR